MQRKFVFSPGEYYHVYNRGVDKRKTFNNAKDYFRLLLLMLLCNSPQKVHIANLLNSYKGLPLVEIFEKEVPEERLVDILTYCVMPNHYHFILREVQEGGISKFMEKMVTGYTMYFNAKYERTGPLFSGRFKARHIDNDNYFRHIFSYIHLNPVDLHQSKWKEDGLKSKKAAIDFLQAYSYSSFVDYFGKEERLERNIVSMDTTLPWLDDVKTPKSLFEFYEREDSI